MTEGCECPECQADRLFDAARLDCQPKSAEDAVYVSGAWRDRVLALANGGEAPALEVPEARRFYRADGTFEELPEAEVRRRRIAAAAAIVTMRKVLLETAAWLVGESNRSHGEPASFDDFCDVADLCKAAAAEADAPPPFDPEWNCPEHFVAGDPTCPACQAKQPRRA